MTKITKARRMNKRGFKGFSSLKAVLYFLMAMLVWFTIHSIVISVDGFTDELNKVDVAVVLGNKVEENGMPSPALKTRLDRSLQLYTEGYFQNIIVSGGVGREGHDEAFVMKKYLVDRGVPSEVIITDSKGYNTGYTAENAKVIMEERGFETAMVISQFFHITRIKLAFRQAGITEAYGAHGRDFFLRDLYSVFREFFAYYKYLLF